MRTQPKRRLGIEVLEDRRMLAPVLEVPDILVRGSSSGFFSHGWLDGESVEYSVKYSNNATKNMGTDTAADYHGFSHENHSFGSTDLLGPVTITATGKFGGIATAQATLVSSRSGTFSDLNVIGPDVLVRGNVQYIYTEGWLPGEKVTYKITWPNSSVYSTYDYAFSNGLSYELLNISGSIPEGTATLDARGKTSGLVLTHQFAVQHLPGSGPETVVIPQFVIPGEEYAVTGLRWTKRAYFYVTQGEEKWLQGSDLPDSHGRISDEITMSEDLKLWQMAMVETRDDKGNTLASAVTLVVDAIPHYTDVLSPSFISAPVLNLAAAQNGGNGSLNYQRAAPTMGNLEGQSFAERSIRGIVSNNAIARTGLTYYDVDRGVDVYAPSGKYFVEYNNGAVELRDIPAGLPPGQDHPFVSEITGTTRSASNLGQAPKEVARTGLSFFDPARGLDVYAGDGKFLIEYADGSIEERLLPTGSFVPRPEDFTIGGLDNSQPKSAFGPTAEELGLVNSGNVPKPSSELVLIGTTYISSSGIVRVAGPGLVFLQDPVTKTILLRPESEASRAIQPSSVISEQSVTTRIAGTSITAAEQQYLEALRNEMVAAGYRFTIEDLWAMLGDTLPTVVGVANATLERITRATILYNVIQARPLLSPSHYDNLTRKIQSLPLDDVTDAMSSASKSAKLLSIARPALKAIDAIETLFVGNDAKEAYEEGGWTDAAAVASVGLLKLGAGSLLIAVAAAGCTATAPACIALAGSLAVGYEVSFVTQPGQDLTEQAVDWFDHKYEWLQSLLADLFK